MEIRAAGVGGPRQGFLCSLLPGFLWNRGPQPRSCFEPGTFSWDFRLIRMTFFCHSKRLSEFSIRVSPSHPYTAGRAGLGWVNGYNSDVCVTNILSLFWLYDRSLLTHLGSDFCVTSVRGLFWLYNRSLLTLENVLKVLGSDSRFPKAKRSTPSGHF